MYIYKHNTYRVNILFLTENEISPMMGGTERITLTLSESFTRMGHRCFLAFGRRCQLPLVAEFAAKLPYDEASDQEQAFADFLSDNQVDIVVSNLVRMPYKRRLLPLLYRLTRRQGARMVVCLHAMPGEEIVGNSLRSSLWRILHGYSLSKALKEMALGIVPTSWIRTLFRHKLQRRYRLLHDNADALVLLSETFNETVSRLGGIPVDEKFTAIPNALSYSHFADEAEIRAKKNEVLIVARMDERSKRISAALKVWRRVERSGQCPDWKLTVVGGGTDWEWYRRMARRMHLRRVTFTGRQEDLTPYYRRASIFMMTSAYEGWGITLTEAQQFGAVPIVYNSYASLSDVVTDGENGLVIPDKETSAYTGALTGLMNDKLRRERLALSAVDASRRYETARVSARWIDLFESLLNHD